MIFESVNTMPTLFLCDLYENNPFYRDRYPALLEISKTNKDLHFLDVYELFDGGAYRKTGDTTAAKHFIENFGRRSAVIKIITYLLDMKYDQLVIANAGNARFFLTKKFYSTLNENGIKTAVFLGDDEFDLSHNLVHAEYCDLPVVYLNSIKTKYQNRYSIKTHVMPNGVSEIYKNTADKNKYSKVTFYGSNFGPRQILIEHLLKNGVEITCYGKGWDLNWNYSNYQYGGFVNSSEFYETLQRHPIHLCLLEDHLTGDVHWTTKVPDAAKMGALPVITLHEDGLETSRFDLLQEGTDYITYSPSDKDSLLQTIKLALNAPRNNNCQQHYLKHLNYLNTYQEFFEVLRNTKITTKKNKRYLFAPKDSDWTLGPVKLMLLKVINCVLMGKKNALYSSIPK